MGERVCIICGRPGKPGRFSCNDCGAAIVERATSEPGTPEPSPAQWNVSQPSSPAAAPAPSQVQWEVREPGQAAAPSPAVAYAPEAPAPPPSAPAWAPEQAPQPAPAWAPVQQAPPPAPAPAPAWGPPPGAPPASQIPAWAPPIPQGWDPNAGGYARPRRKGLALKIVLSVVLGIVLVFGGLVAAVAVFGNKTPAALAGYMDGKGTTYSFPGDTASVRLPEQPKLTTPDNANGVSTMLAGVEHHTYEMWFYKYEGEVLRRADAASVRLKLRILIEAVAGVAGISIQRTSDAPVAGRPARALHGTVKGDQADLVLIYARGKIYGLFVHTKKGSAAVLKEFEKSFELG